MLLCGQPDQELLRLCHRHQEGPQRMFKAIQTVLMPEHMPQKVKVVMMSQQLKVAQKDTTVHRRPDATAAATRHRQAASLPTAPLLVLLAPMLVLWLE